VLGETIGMTNDLTSLVARFADDAATGLALVGADGRFWYVNRTLAAINQRTVEAHVGRRVDDVLGTGAAPVLESLRRVLEEGDTLEEVAVAMPTHTDPSGPDHHYVASYRPLRNEAGAVIAVGVTVLDITERVWVTSVTEQVAALAARLLTAVDPDEVISVTRAATATLFGGDLVNLGLLEEGRETLRLVADVGLDPDLTERYQVVPLGGASPTSDAVRRRRPVACLDPAEIEASYPGPVHRDSEAAGVKAIISVPLFGPHSGVVGAMVLGWFRPLASDPNRLPLLTTVADLCGQALERVRLAEAQKMVLVDLHRLLLPPVLAINGFEVAVRYQPASRELTFGGDWYEVVELDPGRVLVVVGDIVGHGIEAAGAMAEVRLLLKVLTRLHSDLTDVLDAADEFLVGSASETIATVALVVVDREAGTVTSALAGHPPPLLVLADGSVERLEGGLRPPLGVRSRVRRSPVTRAVPNLAVLCAYTDGLVETREQSIDDGIDAVASLLQLGRDEPLAALAALLVASAAAPGADDVALALVRVTDDS